MGILSWWKGGSTNTNTNNKQIQPVSEPKSDPKPNPTVISSEEEVPGMNGAVEVRRTNPEKLEAIVFEFGSIKASADKVTLTGYCPVSEEIEPCRWEILPVTDSDAPQFRVVF